MMAEQPHFAIKVEPDLLREGHFRWTLFESGQPRERSEASYATKGEAYADATKALREYIAEWQAPKSQVT
jgi:hypothetical protein